MVLIYHGTTMVSWCFLTMALKERTKNILDEEKIYNVKLNISFKIYLLRLWLSEGNKNRLPWIVSHCGLNTLLSNENDRWIAWVILGKWLQHLKSYKISADVTFNSLTSDIIRRGWVSKKHTNLWKSSIQKTLFVFLHQFSTNSRIKN